MANATISDIAADIATGDDDCHYLHSVLAQCGLPRSAGAADPFIRKNGKASLLIESGKLPNRDGGWDAYHLPYGTRPRLVLMHICTEAVTTKRRQISMEGSARAFMRKLNIPLSGRIYSDFQAQTLALAACHMTLGWVDVAGKQHVLKCDPLSAFSSWQAEPGKPALWPAELTISEDFFGHLTEHAVPLDHAAVAKLQSSALALDMYTWLAHRLHRVKPGSGLALEWSRLKEQFGQEYGTMREFKREFLRLLPRVRDAYPDARIEEGEAGSGMVFKASSTPIPPKSKPVLAIASDKPKPARMVSKRSAGFTLAKTETGAKCVGDLMASLAADLKAKNAAP
jgi:hypothetical protein